MIADFWENMVRGMARLWLFLARGLGFHIRPDELDIDAIPWLPVGAGYQPFVSPDPETFPFVYTSPYTGRQNIGNRDTPYYPLHGPPPRSISAIIPTSTYQNAEGHRYEPPVEPSPPMDYYPTMPDEDE